MLLTVRLLIPCVTLCCCLCHTALLFLGQVAVVKGELVLNWPTWLNKGEINNIWVRIKYLTVIENNQNG